MVDTSWIAFISLIEVTFCFTPFRSYRIVFFFLVLAGF